MPSSNFPRYIAAAVIAAGVNIFPQSRASARETTTPVNNAQHVSVHQAGILRTGANMNAEKLLPIPAFVHTLASRSVSDTWLDYSMLYLSLPQSTTQPMHFNVRQGVSGPFTGAVTHYYPYAAGLSATNDFIQWQDVQTGVMAEGLETTHPVWMEPRAVAGAATVKVYKPGPPGSKPDDAGTTEGEVYVFMRAALTHTAAPLTVSHHVDSNEWVIKPAAGISVSENTVHAWLARSGTSDRALLSRRIKLESADGTLLLTRTKAALEVDPYTNTALDLRIQLNEALAGNGLHPDEASALSALVLRTLHQSNSPALIYLVPQSWTDANLPLHIEGPAKPPLRVLVGIADIRD